MADQVSQSKRRPPSSFAGGKYVVHKRLGSGCFGEVYRGTVAGTGEEVAIKTEDVSKRTLQQLAHESEILKTMSHPTKPQGFSECYYFGREGNHHCLVMDLLGMSLEDRVRKCGGRFTTKTTVLVAMQVLQRIEYIHSKGIVHRDIKPENFMFGVGDRVHHVYLIDFGLSKKYWEKKHVPLRQKLSLTGTARYASINAHRGIEQSRRDDVEAIGHMFMYFLRGKLPWSGLHATTAEDKYRKIMEKKIDTPLAELCCGYPDAFATLTRHARELDFPQMPNYAMLQDLLSSVANKEGVKREYDFEWFEGKQMPSTLVRLQHPEIVQPDSATMNAEDSRRGLAAPEEVKSSGGFLSCMCGGKSTVRT